ncbi:MAG: deoxyguanosinetriphosphate triphosphohydrolase [candidate division Zixibacteria bacterium]|nr:deoxyguanosinetriphosphate triphosphohydrolase [candidate division Zixibacteria bacterium]
MLLSRENEEKIEAQVLAPYAVQSCRSQGRLHSESEHPYRTCFQRDRDRVIHCGAFRRLKDKTQVFANDQDDHFRTRLTHTMEVAQISRTIARALRLNEDLAEAIALVHDLGHTPFGHAGEQALQEILKGEGGFNHNAQSLRVVDYLEDRYPGWRGLNLTYEVREGIVKHETDYDLPDAGEFEPEYRASLEGQLVNLADEIAYNAHDVDDGYFSGLLTWQALREVSIIDRLFNESHQSYPELPERKRHYHLIRLLINWAVSDLVAATAERIKKYNIKTFADVRTCPINLVCFSEPASGDATALKKFLFAKLYRHEKLLESNRKSHQQVTDLYHAYMADQNLLPQKYIDRLHDENKVQVVKDYIAGMTDRFALKEHQRIIG